MIKIADSRWGDEQTVRLAAIAAVVEEAHRHGAKVSIHSRGSGSTRDAALAGVDWIFHADLATDADLDVVAAAGIPIMMTPGKWHGYEAAFFVKQLGYTPLDVITLQTRENAIAMGLEHQLGTIAPGMIADILILDADPSENVTVLGDPLHVRTIIKDGKPVDLAS